MNVASIHRLAASRGVTAHTVIKKPRWVAGLGFKQVLISRKKHGVVIPEVYDPDHTVSREPLKVENVLGGKVRDQWGRLYVFGDANMVMPEIIINRISDLRVVVRIGARDVI